MIFDTNVHLTVSDKWNNNNFDLNKNLKKNFDKIYKKNKLKGYACVGISNIEKYDHEPFIKKFQKENVFVVPALNPVGKIETQLDLFKKYNCKAVKIHPRSVNKKLSDINNRLSPTSGSVDRQLSQREIVEQYQEAYKKLGIGEVKLDPNLSTYDVDADGNVFKRQ